MGDNSAPPGEHEVDLREGIQRVVLAVRDLLDEVVAGREEQRQEATAVREELGML